MFYSETENNFFFLMGGSSKQNILLCSLVDFPVTKGLQEPPKEDPSSLHSFSAEENHNKAVSTLAVVKMSANHSKFRVGH